MFYSNNSRGDLFTVRTHTGIKILIAFLFLALAGTIAGGFVYLKSQSQRAGFLPETTVNGYDVSDKTPAQVAQIMIADYSAPKVVLNEKGEEAASGSLADFGYTVDASSLQDQIEKVFSKQNEDIFALVESLMHGNSFDVTVPFVYDSSVLKSKVSAASLPAERFPSVNAELKFDDKKSEYYIEPEIYGNEFEDAELQNYVKEKLDQLVSGPGPGKDISVDFPESLYILPEVTSDDLQLNNLANLYNQFTKAKITYLFGSEKVVLDWNTIQKWVWIENGEAHLDEEAIYSYVVSLAAEYNTRYYPRTFNTSIGTTIYIEGDFNTYGYTVDEDAEFSQLLGDIKANTSTEREPIYYSTTMDGFATPVYYARDGKNDLAGNYVEVNLSMQHLWFYRDYQLVVESDLVSGCVAKKTETNTGVFPLAFKESPSTLSGDDGPNGYSVEVQYWMPFSDGQGLHDASWRGSFGGNVYQNSGSHGCINLPLYAAQAIYNQIQAGMAIIVYK